MADTILTQGNPGIASFGSDSVISSDEPRFGDGILETTICDVTATADMDLPIYSVVSLDGTTMALATMSGDPAASDAYGILTAPLVLADGASTQIAVYRTGKFNMNALNWDDSFSTDALKKAAFEGSLSPTIFIEKPLFDSDNINI
jgi:hypothetical protein